MIDIQRVHNYCCDDISLIENYDKAINDMAQTWHCHHRLEIDLNLFKNDLINIGRYYNVPASELIFMTPSDHLSLHANNLHDTTINKMKKSHTGKQLSDITKSRIKKNHCMKDPTVRLKVSNTLMGHIGANIGKHRVYRKDGSFYMSY